MKSPNQCLKLVVIVSISLITHSGHSQQWEWVKAAHHTAPITCDVATDVSKNVYTIHFDVQGSLFVSKMNRHGVLVWNKNYGCCNIPYYNLRVTVDATQNVYIMGDYYTSIQFGNVTLPGGSANAFYSFLTKLDPQGNVVWAKKVAGPTGINEHDLVTDAQGNIVITGNVKGTALIGNTTFPASANTIASYLAKYTSGGQVLWVKKASGTKSAGYSLDTDQQGNIYAIGNYEGSLQWGNTGFPVLSAGSSASYFIRISAGSNIIWGKKIDRAYSIATDAGGSCYLVGDFTGTVNLGNGITLANAQMGDMVIARYDVQGKALWARLATSTVSVAGIDLGIDGYGNCYVVGRFLSTTTFDTKSFSFSPQIASIGFVARYLPSGTIDWVEPIVPHDYTYAERIAVSGSGKCYIVVDNLESGHYLKFGSDLSYTETQDTDVIAKLDGMAQKNDMVVFQLNTFLCFPCFSYDPNPFLDFEYRFWSATAGIRGSNYRKVSDSDNRDEVLWRADYLEIKLHDALPAGTYYFQLRGMREDGSSTAWTETLSFEMTVRARATLIYPNPIADKLTIDYQAVAKETLLVTLYDRNGRILLQKTLEVREGKNVLELPIPMIRQETNPLTLQLQSKQNGASTWQLIRE